MEFALPDFLLRNPYGEIRLAGHRIGLLHVVESHNRGLTAGEILREYPALTADLIEKTIAFYREHRGEVDAYVAETRAQIDRQSAGASRGPTMAELRKRLENRQRATTG